MSKKGLFCIYEINTRVWLNTLSIKYGKPITLKNVPSEEILELKNLGFDAIWLMGVWLPSEKVREIELKDKGLIQESLNILPDFSPEDAAVSPYCIGGYVPAASLGGKEGLIDFREKLNKSGIKLILDFVPNHLALDHPWVATHPEYFINGTKQEKLNDPDSFFSVDNKTVLAHGKDPYFPSWKDVVQLNYFNPDTRKAMQGELLKAASFCDGLRCDMAMLILKKIQLQVWGKRVFGSNGFDEPKKEFWQDAIKEVKKSNPDFLFVAEVYWDLEVELVSLGFDYVYDKPFYDALRYSDNRKIKESLTDEGQLKYKRLRFIENHDENRAITVFGVEKSKAAALIMLFAPGTHLLHQGQMEGFAIKLPVRLIRMPKEEIDRRVFLFYTNLLSGLKALERGKSQWALIEAFPVWQDNQSFCNFFAFSDHESHLAVVNYSQTQSQCYLRLPLDNFHSKYVLFKDLLGSSEYIRDREEITSRGLYLDMPAYGLHFFSMTGND